MLMIFFICIFIMFLSILIMNLSSILSKKIIMDREKNSPFECGFDPNSSSRMPFSIQFFLIAVIFLIFDVEIALLLPMIMTLLNSNLMSWTYISFIFIIILLLGLFHEWNQNTLNWAN
uniref:NADH-ubiquinone oxidoreductase chain 3 n=1 Tax=Boreus elegans TaxID=948611 RepID=E9NQ65_BOREL|nr:NADH dehydrogenase subunit 3 [Boreus elegans]